MGREEFVGSLPLPLAQLWRRAHDTAAAERRRAAARDIVEVAIRLRAHASLQRPLPDPSLAAAWKTARAADPFFSTELAASPCFAEIGVSLGLTQGTVADVLDRAMEDGETVEAAALLAAAGDMLRHVDVLAGRRLVYARTGVCYELRGEAPRPIVDPEREAGRAPLSVERVALAGPDGAVDWDDVARFDSDTVEFYLRVDGDWVCHATGRRRPAGGRADTPTLRADASPGDRATRPRVEERVPERRRLGEFAVLSRIGEGGMGVVYRAWQPSLGRCVAVKCVRAGGDEKSLVRFDREIRALGRVEHPNLVKIFTSGSEGDQWYYAMELVEGADLERISRKLAESAPASEIGELQWRTAISRATTEAQRQETVFVEPPAGASMRPPSTARDRRSREHDGEGHVERSAEIVRQIAEAAHALHEAGLVHRDIKPGNVILDSSGTHATLMDLGLVRSIRDAGDGVTRTQQFVGTLRYASPEQLLGENEVDREADVYSLGVTLYELLTLQPIFDATNSTPTPIVIDRILNDEAVLPRKLNPRVPRDLQSICLKCLEKDPKRRYATAADLAEDIARWQAMEPVRAKTEGPIGRVLRRARRLSLIRPWTFAAAVVAIAFVGTVAFLEFGGERPRVFDRAIGTVLKSLFHSPRVAAAWDEMAIVAFDDASHGALPRIAESLGPAGAGVDPAAIRTWRPVHGALMKRLAVAKPSVVAWDYAFEVPDARFDAELAAGLDALRAAGVRTVLGVWNVDASGEPALCDVLRDRFDAWGWMLLASETIDRDYVTGGCLVERRPQFDTTLGLSLAAYVAYRHRECFQRCEFVEQNSYIDILCGATCPTRTTESGSAGSERIRFADIEPENPLGLPAGLDVSTRRVACAEVGFPDDALMASRTTSYADVFSLSPEDLSARFAGRLVFVGDGRFGFDRHRIDRDGRQTWGVNIHAATAGDLIAHTEYARHGLLLEYLLLPAFAAMSLVLFRAMPLSSATLRSAAVIGVMALVSLVASVVAAGSWRVLMSPTELVVSSSVAIALAAAVGFGTAKSSIVTLPSSPSGKLASSRRSRE